MLSFPNVLNFFAHEFAGLRGWSFAFSFVPSGTFNCVFVWLRVATSDYCSWRRLGIKDAHAKPVDAPRSRQGEATTESGARLGSCEESTAEEVAGAAGASLLDSPQSCVDSDAVQGGPGPIFLCKNRRKAPFSVTFCRAMTRNRRGRARSRAGMAPQLPSLDNGV